MPAAFAFWTFDSAHAANTIDLLVLMKDGMEDNLIVSHLKDDVHMHTIGLFKWILREWCAGFCNGMYMNQP
jgi:hypothetical protein